MIPFTEVAGGSYINGKWHVEVNGGKRTGSKLAPGAALEYYPAVLRSVLLERNRRERNRHFSQQYY